MDPVLLFSRALANTATIVEAVAPDRLTVPTPCPEWSARDVLNHVVAGLHYSAAVVDGRPVDGSPYTAPEVVGDDPVAAYAGAAKVAVDAFSAPGGLERSCTTPLGEMPGARWIWFPTFDVYVHGWDLARAWGVTSTFPDEITAPVLAFLRPRFDMPQRPVDQIGVPHDVPADAPLMDQLVAYLGRDPGWRA
jgi:uncharacterized protein (TIGR03086 family)